MKQGEKFKNLLKTYSKQTGIKMQTLTEKIGLSRTSIYAVYKADTIKPEYIRSFEAISGQDIMDQFYPKHYQSLSVVNNAEEEEEKYSPEDVARLVKKLHEVENSAKRDSIEFKKMFAEINNEMNSMKAKIKSIEKKTNQLSPAQEKGA